MVVLLAVRVGERVQFSQQQRVLQHSLDGFDKVRLQRGRMLLFGVALVQKSLEGSVCLRCGGHKHSKLWLCRHRFVCFDSDWWHCYVFHKYTMFSSTLNSSTNWKTLLRNHHKSAESMLNNKNRRREDPDQPHRHPHTAGELYDWRPRADHMRFTDPQPQGSVKIPEFSKVMFELRFTYLWPALWAL